MKSPTLLGQSEAPCLPSAAVEVAGFGFRIADFGFRVSESTDIGDEVGVERQLRECRVLGQRLSRVQRCSFRFARFWFQASPVKGTHVAVFALQVSSFGFRGADLALFGESIVELWVEGSGFGVRG